MWNNAALTLQGAEIINALLSGSILQITKAAGGSETSDEPTQLTGLVAQKQEFKIENIKKSDGRRRVAVKLTTEGLTEEYQLRQIGLFGRLNGEKQDTLIMVVQDETGITIPTYEDMPGFTITFYLYLSVDNSAQVTVVSDNQEYITREDLQEAINGIDIHCVVVAASAPTDTSKLWVDTVNTCVKYWSSTDSEWKIAGKDAGVVRQATAPDNTNMLWIDTANEDALKYYNGTTWVEINQKGSAGVARQATPPEDTGTLWIDTGNSDALKYYNGTTWVEVTVSTGDIVTYDEATESEAGLMSASDKKKMNRHSGDGFVVASSAPSNTSKLWVDSGNGGIMKYYNGSAWKACPAVWG